MRKVFYLVLIFLGIGCKPSIYLQRNTIQLSDPKIILDNVFFEESTVVKISPTTKKAKLYFSMSGQEMQQYKKPIQIKESHNIVVQAIGGGYMPSDSTSIELVKLPKNEIISLTSERELNEKYGDGGLDILVDRKKGEPDFNNGWLGYAGDTILYDINFDVIEVDHVIISSLRNQNAWIFSPSQINIYANGKQVGNAEIRDCLNEMKYGNVITKVSVIKTNTRKLTVEIIAPKEIPSWHSGAGSKPWIFIDEILIY